MEGAASSAREGEPQRENGTAGGRTTSATGRHVNKRPAERRRRTRTRRPTSGVGGIRRRQQASHSGAVAQGTRQATHSRTRKPRRRTRRPSSPLRNGAFRGMALRNRAHSVHVHGHAAIRAAPHRRTRAPTAVVSAPGSGAATAEDSGGGVACSPRAAVAASWYRHPARAPHQRFRRLLRQQEKRLCRECGPHATLGRTCPHARLVASMATLPDDVVARVAAYLPLTSLMALSRASVSLCVALSSNALVWRQVWRRRYALLWCVEACAES